MHNDNARPQIHYFPLAMSAFATSPVASPAVDGMVAADEADEEELALRRLVTPARIEARLRRVMGPDCDISGTDSGDKIYTSIRDLWDKEFQVRSERRTDWYQKGYDYWESEENCPISDDGVLGGFGRLTAVDTRDSNAFLDSVASGPRLGLRLDRAADCGAGIGRVSKNLLLPRCGHVDLVEQSPRLLQASAGYIGVDAVRTTLVNAGLQDFVPPPNTYDLIWIQWVIGQLDDLDFVRFFRRCANGLTPHGVIVLKDNCSEDWTFSVDRDDSSVARHIHYMKVLFDMADCQVLQESIQADFPAELCAVHMIALCPKTSSI